MKASGASFQESKRTGEIEFTPKGCAQRLTDARVQDRGSHSTGARVSLAAGLGTSAGELGGHCGSQWGIDTGQPFLGAPSTTWHWCWWRQRGNLPIAPRCQDLAQAKRVPPTSRQAAEDLWSPVASFRHRTPLHPSVGRHRPQSPLGPALPCPPGSLLSPPDQPPPPGAGTRCRNTTVAQPMEPVSPASPTPNPLTPAQGRNSSPEILGR